MPRLPVFSTKFKRDLARVGKQGKDSGKLKAVIALLIAGEPLPANLKDHALIGEWKKTSGMPHRTGLAANLSAN